MARYEFGGTMAAWVVSTVTNDEVFDPGTEVVSLPTETITLDIYDAPGGSGTLVTDFLDENGDPVTEITIQVGDPYIPRFQGPDGMESLWVQSATGRWIPVPRWDDGTGTGGGSGSDPDAVKLAGNNETTITDPYVQFLRIDLQGAENDSPNRFEIRYYDETTSKFRPGLHANEKGLLRVRGVTPNDVPVRFIAHPSLSDTWPVMEVTGDNSQDPNQKIFQVFQHSVRATVGVQVPYLVNPKGERLYFGSYDPNEDEAWAGVHRPRVGDGWLDFTGADADDDWGS